ncbi:hypothetical protein FBU30_009048 [Linnemannia zychae]|nr:hypothetical protein FBU30_009048 [Linnemannia zychae]
MSKQQSNISSSVNSGKVPAVSGQTMTTKTTTISSLTARTVLTKANIATINAKSSTKTSKDIFKPFCRSHCPNLRTKANAATIPVWKSSGTEHISHQYLTADKHSTNPEHRAFSSKLNFQCRRCGRQPLKLYCMECNGCYPNGCCQFSKN